MIEAREAKAWGLVNEVVPLDALEDTVRLARKSQSPSMSNRMAKAALNRAVVKA
jgi:enoyl-CoA hydratase/carnithine racemase